MTGTAATESVGGLMELGSLQAPPAREHFSSVDTTGEQVVRMRVAISPMYSLVASLFEVLGGWRRGADERWAAQMLARADGIDLSPLAFFASPVRMVPDFVVPLPQTERTRFRDELARVAATTPEEMRRCVVHDFGDDWPDVYDPWMREPERAIAAYVRAVGEWYEAVIAPEWPRMEAILETEVLRVGRLLATRGWAETLSRLHPRLRWRDGRFEVRRSCIANREGPVGGREILIKPMACGSDSVLTSITREDVISLAYGAPGCAALFTLDQQPQPDGLAEILGKGRASVLRALESPARLRAVAALARLAESTTCEHLGALAASDLVTRGSVEGRVVYARSARGERLVELF